MKTIIKIFNLLIFFLVVLNIASSGQVIDYGAQSRELSKTISALEYETNKLEIKLARETSFINIAQKIKESGFVEPKQVLSVTSLPPVAKK